MRHLEWLFFFPPNFLTRNEKVNKILPEIVQLLKLGRLLATRSLGRSSVQKLQPRILQVEFNFVCLTWWCSGWQNDQDEYERHNYGRVSVRLAQADKWLGTYNNNTLLVGSTLPKNDQNWLVGFWQLWIFSTLSVKQGVVCFCRIHCLYWNERLVPPSPPRSLCQVTEISKFLISGRVAFKIFDIWPRSWNYEKKERTVCENENLLLLLLDTRVDGGLILNILSSLFLIEKLCLESLIKFVFYPIFSIFFRRYSNFCWQ